MVFPPHFPMTCLMIIFFPGSTFKLVTAAAGIESGLIDAVEPVYAQSDAYEPIPAGAPIRNFGGSTCGGDLVEILRVSCNTAFAEMGAEWVGPEGMVTTAEAFGFNTTPNIDLPSAATSRFPTDYGNRLADAQTMKIRDRGTRRETLGLVNAEIDARVASPQSAYQFLVRGTDARATIHQQQ